MQNKLILGFTGQMASGKGTAAQYFIEKHGATSHRFSTMLRDVLDRLFIKQSRENLQKLSTSIREIFGEDTLSKVIAEDVKNDSSNIIVIDGIRRMSDIEYLKEIPGFILINMTADINTRYDRLTKRTENTDDTNKTFEQFKEDHRGEAEAQIANTGAKANIQLDNNGSLEELYAKLDELIS